MNASAMMASLDFTASLIHLALIFKSTFEHDPCFPTDFGIIPYYFDILVDASDYPVKVYGFFDIILFQGW
jgi:hypothetical protein